MNATKSIFMTLVILISGSLHATTDEDCNNVLAFQPRKRLAELTPNVGPKDLNEPTAQIIKIADRLSPNSPVPVIDGATVALVTDRLEDLSEAATALVKGVRLFISHGPSTTRENTRVFNLGQHRLFVTTLIPVLVKLDKHISKYAIWFTHPDFIRLTEEHPNLLKMLNQIEQDFALYQAIARDTRMNSIAPEINALQMNRVYRGGSVAQADINEEFELPFYKRTTPEYIENGLAVLLADEQLLYDTIGELGRLAQSPLLATLNAQASTNNSLVRTMDTIVPLMKRYASNLEIFSKEVNANTTKSDTYPRFRARVFQHTLLSLLKSNDFKAIRDKEFVIDRSRWRKLLKKSRFAIVPALVNQLETEIAN